MIQCCRMEIKEEKRWEGTRKGVELGGGCRGVIVGKDKRYNFAVTAV